MKRLVMLCALLIGSPALAVDYEQQLALSGPLAVQITCPTTDFIGVSTSYVVVGVAISSFSSNTPAQLHWGVWENDVIDDMIWEETVNPSTSDPEYDPSLDLWVKMFAFYCDIAFYEPAQAQAQVYGWAEMTTPDYTAQTPDVVVNLITDSTAPQTTITSPAAGTYGPNITFQFAATDDYTVAGEFKFYCWLDPLESKPASPAADTSKTYGSLSAGNYTFYVAAVDLGLNEDPTPATVACTVEIVTAPGAGTPISIHLNDLLLLTVPAGTSTEGHALEQRVDFGDGFISPWSDTTSVSHTYTIVGIYQLRIQSRCVQDGIESAWSDPCEVSVIPAIAISDSESGGCVPAAGHPSAMVLLFSVVVFLRHKLQGK